MKTLYITNKNYSSWSLRPWVLMKELQIEFEEIMTPLNTGNYWQDFRKFSPNGKVPCLQDGQYTVWDSLAIIEFLHESHANIWPSDKSARTWARCASAEMHSGFPAMRNQCPMSCGLRINRYTIDDALQHDINRIDEIWNHGLDQYKGPFLAGNTFTAVDAFFAPIVFRVQTFNLPFSKKAQKYMQVILSLSSVQDWYAAALKETWREIEHEKETQEAGETINDYREL